MDLHDTSTIKFKRRFLPGIVAELLQKIVVIHNCKCAMKIIAIILLIFALILGGCEAVHIYATYRIHSLSADDFVGEWVSSENPQSSLSLHSNFQACWINFPVGKDNDCVSGVGEWSFDNFQNLDPKISLKTGNHKWSLVPIFWNFFSSVPMLGVWHNIDSGDVEYFEKQMR